MIDPEITKANDQRRGFIERQQAKGASVETAPRYPRRAVYIMAHGLQATVPEASYERCESCARQLLDRLIEHGFRISDV